MNLKKKISWFFKNLTTKQHYQATTTGDYDWVWQGKIHPDLASAEADLKRELSRGHKSVTTGRHDTGYIAKVDKHGNPFLKWHKPFEPKQKRRF